MLPLTTYCIRDKLRAKPSPPSVRGSRSPPVRGTSVEGLRTPFKVTTVYPLAPDYLYSSSMQNTVTPSQDENSPFQGINARSGMLGSMSDEGSSMTLWGIIFIPANNAPRPEMNTGLWSSVLDFGSVLGSVLTMEKCDCVIGWTQSATGTIRVRNSVSDAR